MSKNDRIVFHRNDGKWVNRLVDAERASSLHNTQLTPTQLPVECCGVRGVAK